MTVKITRANNPEATYIKVYRYVQRKYGTHKANWWRIPDELSFDSSILSPYMRKRYFPFLPDES